MDESHRRLLLENPTPLRQLGRQLPGRPRYRTVRDWARIGVIPQRYRGKRRAGKHRVKLETIFLTCECSSMAAYLRMIEKVNEPDATPARKAPCKPATNPSNA